MVLKVSKHLCYSVNHVIFVRDLFQIYWLTNSNVLPIHVRAREIVGFAGSGPIFETEDRFISRQEAKKSVHKTLYFSRFCNIQTDIVTCQNCSHLIIRCYLS